MPRYWVVAPFAAKKPDLFEKVWELDLANNLISVGWSQLGDISQMTREKLADAVASAYPDKPAPAKGLTVNMLRAFYHEIAPGDFVIARRGRKTLAAVGKVTSSANYVPGGNPAASHSSILNVTWQEQPRDKVYTSVVFPLQTVAELSEARYHELLEGKTGPVDTPEPPEAVADRNEFALEKYLQEFIVSNFDSIFKGGWRFTRAPTEPKASSTTPTGIGSTFWRLSPSQTPSW